MPSWMPEGNTVKPGDDDVRTAAKWCQNNFDLRGNKPSPFPEGCAPKPGDDLHRLFQKIRLIQS